MMGADAWGQLAFFPEETTRCGPLQQMSHGRPQHWSVSSSKSRASIKPWRNAGLAQTNKCLGGSPAGQFDSVHGRTGESPRVSLSTELVNVRERLEPAQIPMA